MRNICFRIGGALIALGQRLQSAFRPKTNCEPLWLSLPPKIEGDKVTVTFGANATVTVIGSLIVDWHFKDGSIATRSYGDGGVLFDLKRTDQVMYTITLDEPESLKLVKRVKVHPVLA